MTLEITDDRGRVLTFGRAPVRVVSLVPSETYNLSVVGAIGALVGRTDYCVLPEAAVAKVPSVGGTKNPRVKDIVALAPDLVLANQEENTKGDLEALAAAGVRVFISFPKRVAEGIAHVARLARIFRTERDPAVHAWMKTAYLALRAAEKLREETPPLRVFCPIWMNPLMTIHGETFMSDALDLAGAANVFADRERRYPLAADLGRAAAKAGASVAGKDIRYPRVTLEEIVARAPDLIVLPEEPHPFSDGDEAVFRALDVPAAKRGAIVRTSGRELSWIGALAAERMGEVRAMVDRFRPGPG